MAPRPDNEALADVRRRAVRGLAFATTAGAGVLLIAAPFVMDRVVPSVVMLSMSVLLNLVAAGTVGRHWDPAGWVGFGYALVMVVIIAVAIEGTSEPLGDSFWYLLVPILLTSLTQPRRRHSAMVAIAFVAYLVAAAMGPGTTTSVALPRGVALIIFAVSASIIMDRHAAAVVQTSVATTNLQTHLDEANAVNDRLRELDVIKDDFVAIASHELRTPLTVVLGFAQTLHEHWDVIDDEDRRLMAERIEKHASGLHSIVATLLDTARLEHGSLHVQTQQVDIASMIKAAVARSRPLLRAHTVTIEADGDSVLAADSRLVERVLDNLLTNAGRHTPVGSTITLRAVPDLDVVHVEVTDNGPGIADEDLAHIGVRFHRAGAADRRTRDGVGLGLALVTEILTTLGSELRVTTQLGEGTTFAFTLPAWSPEQATAATGHTLPSVT